MPCPLCDDTGWKPIEEKGGSVGVRRVERCDCWRGTVSRQRLAGANVPKRYQHCTIANFTAYNESLQRAVLLALGEDLRVMIRDSTRFGGGDFCLRLMADGKIRKNVNFSIVRGPNPLIAPPKEDNSMMGMMFNMMMRQSEEAARQRSEDMRDRQAASERQMTAIIGLATVAVPVLMGGREKTSELMTAIAALRPPEKGNDLKSTIETMAAAGATCLCISAGKTLMFDRDEMIALADRNKIAIVAV